MVRFFRYLFETKITGTMPTELGEMTVMDGM
jgi:hypothetical protein